jgi:hypothetical protein
MTELCEVAMTLLVLQNAENVFTDEELSAAQDGRTLFH